MVNVVKLCFVINLTFFCFVLTCDTIIRSPNQEHYYKLGCVDKKPMSVKRPPLKMPILTDYSPENVYDSSLMPTRPENGRW